MALVAPAKRSLWDALRVLRSLRPRDIEASSHAKLKQHIEDAILLLEMTPDMIDPALKLK